VLIGLGEADPRVDATQAGQQRTRMTATFGWIGDYMVMCSV
jgi:hypothetical protein